jgi:hypothetical protein
MTVDAPWSFLTGDYHAWDALSAWLILPGAPSTDRSGALLGLPAGPGRSAVDMAAACLTCADGASLRD